MIGWNKVLQLTQGEQVLGKGIGAAHRFSQLWGLY
jgi:hypothetical protein